MKIFRDVITEDELFSDIFPIELIADGTVYKVKGKMVSENFQLDESAIGGNASAEGGGDEATDGSSTTGVNICINHKLVESHFNKKTFKTSIQAYMKAVKAYLTDKHPDQVGTFSAGVQPFIKSILGEFDEYQFWFGEKGPDRGFDGMAILMRWDGETPYLYFFKHGLQEEKC